jgi:hypothetical protein
MGDYGWSVRQTDDGGYIMVGQFYSVGGSRQDVYVVKTDSLGIMEWDQVYGDTLHDCGRDILQTMDGGYVITGSTTPHFAWDSDLWLLKLDSLGDTVWTRIYSTIGTDGGEAVVETADSGYVITGMNGTGAAYSLWIFKTDRNGIMLWSKVYSLGSCSGGRSIHETSDGGFVIGGNVFLVEFDFLLLKTDSLGDTVWTRNYGGQSGEDAYDVIQTPEGGYVLVGPTGSFGAGWEPDVYVVRTDSLGDTLWTRTFGGTQSDYATSIDLTPDGGYIIAGSTESFGAGGNDVWLLRIETDPYGVEEHGREHCAFEYVGVCPNPFCYSTDIRFQITDNRQTCELKIYDITGRQVTDLTKQISVIGHQLSVRWDGTDHAGRRLPSGVYFIKFELGDWSIIKRVILVR